MAPNKFQEQFLSSGVQSHAEGNLDAALEHFRKCILICDCNRNVRNSARQHGISSKDIPLPICVCKDYLSLPSVQDLASNSHNGTIQPTAFQASAIRSRKSKAIYNLATTPCSCGSGIKPCKNASHLKALSHTITVLENQKSYKKAQQFASLLITMAPHAPEGYLKMARILRLRDTAQSPKTMELCQWLYSQGNHNVRADGYPNTDLSKRLSKSVRKDIIRDVPREIAIIILQHLSLGDLCCRAMRVSHTWQVICLDPGLWRHLRFVKNFNQTKSQTRLRPGVLNNIILRRSAGFSTSVTIDGLWDFGFNSAVLEAMLKVLPNLKTLKLSGSRGIRLLDAKNIARTHPRGVTPFLEFWQVICTHAPSQLASISLSGFNIGHYTLPDDGVFAAFAYDWLNGTRLARSLQSLSLAQIVPQDLELVLVGTLCRNDFSKLETLSLIGPGLIDQSKQCPHPRISLSGLRECAPSLKDLTLDATLEFYNEDTRPNFLEQVDDFTSDDCLPNQPWAELRRLRLSYGDLDDDPYMWWPIVPLSGSIRSLEYGDSGLYHAWKLSEYFKSTHCPEPVPEGLEHFVCRFSRICSWSTDVFELIEPDNPLQFLRPSIAAGNLRSLSIGYLEQLADAVDQVFAGHEGVLTTLSCEMLMMAAISHGPETGNFGDCIEWMASTFPNLKVVGLYPDIDSQGKPHELGYLVVPRFIKRRPDVKTIYTSVGNLRGAIRDAVLRMARQNGVTVIEADRVPEPVLAFPPPAPWANPAPPVEEGEEDFAGADGSDADGDRQQQQEEEEAQGKKKRLGSELAESELARIDTELEDIGLPPLSQLSAPSDDKT